MNPGIEGVKGENEDWLKAAFVSLRFMYYAGWSHPATLCVSQLPAAQATYSLWNVVELKDGLLDELAAALDDPLRRQKELRTSSASSTRR